MRLAALMSSLVLTLSLSTSGTFAQTAPATPAPPEGQNAILPSADNHRNSAAPTMSPDCAKSPETCSKGLSASDAPDAKSPVATQSTPGTK
jgi:hypothetical protein